MANKQANPCLQGTMDDLLKSAQTGTDSAVKIFLRLYVFGLEYQRSFEIPEKKSLIFEVILVPCKGIFDGGARLQ